MTATVRLLEVLDVFRSDFRVRVLFVVDARSEFGDGVLELLRSAGARIVSQRYVQRVGIDLVVTTSSKAAVGVGDAPVIVVPHGVGFHKYVDDDPGGRPRLSGAISRDVARSRKVIQVLTDESQRALLAAHRPEVGERAVVVRDPFLERLRAGRNLRERYRRRLGVGNRRLLVITTTWGEQSLFARWQRLPAQALRELPADEYAVAAILHPNVWIGDGPWQVRTWLANAREGGLILVPPDAGWQATLVSADLVIGDHGSVTFYAAALGLPLLIGAFGEQVVPNTPMAELGGLAPRLDWNSALPAQLRQAISAHDPSAFARVTGAAFGGDRSGTSLRKLLYDNLELPEPDGDPEVWAWPEPVPEQQAVTSFAVHTRTTSAGEVEISRFPASVDDAGRHLPVSRTEGARHLAAYDDELNLGRRQSASTLINRDPSRDGAARTWVGRHEGNHRVVAAAGASGVWLRVRDGGLFLASAGEVADPMLVTAVVYHLLLRSQLPRTVSEHTAIAGETSLSLKISAISATSA